MKTTITISTLVAASNAFLARDTGCCFHATASGGKDGTVGQLPDGQNRIGDTSLPIGQYCISNTGGLVDSHGRGCVITAPTKQWQCDAGAFPTSGFTIGSDGTLGYSSGSDFFACPTEDNGGWNLYTETLMGEPKCVKVKLTADNCKAQPPPQTPAPAPSQCPAELPANGWEFPHLIIPIDDAHPDTCYKTSYNGTAGGTQSSIFNFDIPASAKGKTCKLQFLFPKQAQLETSAYTFSGEGRFKFASLQEPATEATTFNTAPKVQQDFGGFLLTPGSAVDVASVACPAGEKIGIWLHALEGSYIDFFQDYNPCPIGLYIIVE